MDFTTIIGVMAFIAAFAGAIKALDVIWDYLKKFGKFVVGTGDITDLPEIKEDVKKTHEAIDALSKEFKFIIAKFDALSHEFLNHMAEEERQRDEQVDMMRKFADHLSQQDSVIFRQAVFTSETPYYETRYNVIDGEWHFVWCNRAWSDLTGISLPRAKIMDWEDIVGQANMTQVNSQIMSESGPIEVEMVIKNWFTNNHYRVLTVSCPMKDIDGNVIRYVGSIQVLEDLGVR